VITVLTNPVRGYMGAPADRALAVHSRGRKLHWGTVAEGPVRRWEASAKGETSSLTLADGTAFAVDFTGASGAGVLLATTGAAEGQVIALGSARITLGFPTADQPPVARIEGPAVVVGRQRLTLRAGHLEFAERGR